MSLHDLKNESYFITQNKNYLGKFSVMELSKLDPFRFELFKSIDDSLKPTSSLLFEKNNNLILILIVIYVFFVISFLIVFLLKDES
jgi:hypothetical protein